MTSNSHRGSPGSIPLRNQIYSLLLIRNWRVEAMGGEGGVSRGYVKVTLAGSCRMRWILNHEGEKIMLLIAARKYRTIREACNGQCPESILECNETWNHDITGLINLVVVKQNSNPGRRPFLFLLLPQGWRFKGDGEGRKHKVVCRRQLGLEEWGKR